jgi:uncharacterized protein
MLQNKKIVIAGGTGFMGVEMIRYFGTDNDITVLTRKIPNSENNRNNQAFTTTNNVTYIKWDATTLGDWVKDLEGIDLLINLTGRTVNCRYTEKNKYDIIYSRVQSTKILNEAVSLLSNKPKVWMNASSATIYKSSYDKPNDEYTGDIVDNFSVEVCKQWEAAFFETKIKGVRKIALRMAITLGGGGVLIPYFNLLKYGLGGTQGSGKQMFSWIHIEDTCRMIAWAYENENIESILNCCAPYPVTNKELMQTFRKICTIKIGLPAYKWMLQLGAKLIGTEVELVLKSRYVIPTKALQNGFTFKYAYLQNALTEIIKNVPKKQYKLF